MYLRPTQQLSKEATQELLKEFASPKCTPELQAQKERVKAMAAKIQKKAEAKSRPVAVSR
jgi:hypothetical protein